MNEEIAAGAFAPGSFADAGYPANREPAARPQSTRPWRRHRADSHRPHARNQSRGLTRPADYKFSVYTAKRLFDVTFAALFLLTAGWWLLPLISLAIRLDSPGPALFKQKRVGYLGQHFICLKFRTMEHNPQAQFRQATRDDPRITPVGRFLRATNLDELPQFINVLRGDMAIVGPRPHVPELDCAFTVHVPLYMYRRAVRPGLTGLAQVRGHRGETRSIREMSHRVRMDNLYLSNHDFAMDLKIVWWTILCVLRGDENAY